MTNIAELLRNAPEGLKLYSPLFGEVEFAEVMETDYVPIRVMKYSCGFRFDEYGRYMGNEYPDSECLLFPSKDCRTWEGWKLLIKPKFKVGDWVVKKDGTTFHGGNYAEQVTLIEGDEYLKCIWLSSTSWVRDNDIRLWTIQDAKDGDVLVLNGFSKEYKWIGIFKALTSDTSFSSHCHYNCGMCEFVTDIARCTKHGIKYNDIRPATNEERDILFAKMREAGYTWDENKKELKKFPKHYDISNFHAGMPVLVRADNVCRWNYSVFSHITGNKDWQFAVCNGVSFTQCIPFEGNETLLGTSDMCNERFVNW